MASIRKRGSAWHVQVRRSGQPSTTRSFKKKSDALEWARQIGRETDRRGLAPNRNELERITLGDLLRKYRAEVVVHKRSKEREDHIIEVLLRDKMSEFALNRRRYGRRDPETGRIVTAFGFELTELRRALPVLRQAKAGIDAENARRHTLKRRLSAIRGRVRKLTDAVIAQGGADQIARAREISQGIKGRINEGTGIRELEARIVAADRARQDLETLLLQGKTCGSDVKISDTSEKNFRPIDSPTDLQTDFQSGCSPDGDNTAGKPVRAAPSKARPGGLSRKNPEPFLPEFLRDFDGPVFVPPEGTGAHRVQARLALRAATPRFQAHAPLESRRPTPDDVIDAAKSLLPELRISCAAWRYACQIVGPYPAALCVLVTDHAAAERGLRSPGGYFRSMAKRALTGDLALDRSIFGFLNG